jgi:carboxylate-amine ligase
VNSLVDFLEPVLTENGEIELARQGVEAIFARGTGAAEQRGIRQVVLDKAEPDDGGLGAVVAHAVRATHKGEGQAGPDNEDAPELLRVRQL